MDELARIEEQRMRDEFGVEGVSKVIWYDLPSDEKGLMKRLDRLYANLAKNASSAIEGKEYVCTKARIKQVEFQLSRFDAQRLSKRERWSFAISAGGLIVAALATVLSAVLR